jgi:hypothetical protein
MARPDPDRTWLEVTQQHLGELYETIETTKGQLYLALAVLMSLGFDLSDFADLLP